VTPVLVLLILGGPALSLVFSRGLVFAWSSQDVFCRKCGAIERTRRAQVLAFKYEKTSYRETLLKKRAFAEVAHCKEHHARNTLEKFTCSFNFKEGFKSSGFGNYWSPDGLDVWSIGPPTPTTQMWTNQSPAGFCLHEDSVFVAAFARLVECDPVWSRHQLEAICGGISRKSFPGTLVQFKTNRTVEAIFNHLQRIDLDAADVGLDWERDEAKFPRGGTNEPAPFVPLVTPLRMRLY
jgi:hypothetical protein